MLTTTYKLKKRVAPLLMAAAMVVFYPISAAYATADTAAVAPEPAAQGTTTTAAPQQTPAPAPAATKEAPAPAVQQAVPTTGPQQPTGDSSKTYKKNPATGNYENDYYTWDPATGKAAPKQETNYSYNPETKMWDTKKWQYNPASGTYQPSTVSSATPPSGAMAASGGNPQDSVAAAAGLDGNPLSSGSSGSSINTTGPNSSNEINGSNDNGSFFDGFFNGSISNIIGSNAVSGNASVTGNTEGGSAATGDASAIANVINLLQSSFGWTQDLVTFISNIYGDYSGDIMLRPGQTVASQASNADVDVNIESNASINNDINLTAKSGNASVEKNTLGGDAASGDATALANVINLINSSISAGDSFLGMLNFYGDLNGDVLLPPGVLEDLIASNGDTSGLGSDVVVNNASTQTIKNNVGATATSGNANVANNTSAGNATTGDAQTDLTILNLTGRQIVGDNALLVFVNVFGKWVGMIVDAPQGSTAAALGGGLDTNSSLGNGGDAAINSRTNQNIVNDINVNAGSGDATVASNTIAGDATTGDANAAVNLANISNSQFSLSDWFGVLFINVFGNWNGSFGIDTPAGDNPALGKGAAVFAEALKTNSQRTSPAQMAPVATSDAVAVAAANSLRLASAGNASTTGDDRNLPGSIALAGGQTAGGGTSSPLETRASSKASWFITAIGVFVGIILLGTERVLSMRDTARRRTTATA